MVRLSRGLAQCLAHSTCLKHVSWRYPSEVPGMCWAERSKGKTHPRPPVEGGVGEGMSAVTPPGERAGGEPPAATVGSEPRQGVPPLVAELVSESLALIPPPTAPGGQACVTHTQHPVDMMCSASHCTCCVSETPGRTSLCNPEQAKLRRGVNPSVKRVGDSPRRAHPTSPRS